MSLHPYDGRTRRFRHDDAAPREGDAILERLLGRVWPEAAYELSFYSGGLGTLDRIAVAGTLDRATFEATCDDLGAVSVEQALLDPSWGPELADFLDCESRWPFEAALAFVSEERHALQPVCDHESAIRFVRGSDVNDWSVLFWSHGRAAYLACTQG